MEGLKKYYKIGDKIEVEELQEVAQGVAFKALKVIASNGDLKAIDILEGRHPEIMEDCIQEVSLKILENSYILTKECYRCIRSIVYKLNRDIIELILNEENEQEQEKIDAIAYCKYISSYGEVKKTSVFNIDALGLTEKQKAIVNIYANTQSLQQTADILGVSKSTISNTIYRLRDRISYLNIKTA